MQTITMTKAIGDVAAPLNVLQIKLCERNYWDAIKNKLKELLKLGVP